MQTIKRVGIWIRVSTDQQAETDSPKHHYHRAIGYAAVQGWEVVEACVYRLEGVRGAESINHPEMLRMKADIESGAIQGLIFSDLFRLARSTRDLLDLAEFFREHDAAMVSLDEKIDTSGPHGMMVYTIIAALGQWQREKIAESVAASVKTRAQLGKNLGGQAIYGYQWTDAGLVPHPEERKVRVLMYELYAERQRYAAVADALNARGYRTRNGGLWTNSSVMVLIKDPTAIGRKISNKSKSKARSKGNRWDLKPTSDWVETPVEPIVDRELWERCQAIRQAAFRPLRRKPKTVYAGLLVCWCGQRMYVESRGQRYRCYRPGCCTTLPEEALDAYFETRFRAPFEDPEVVTTQTAHLQARLETRAGLLADVRRKLADAQRGQTKLLELLSTGKLDPDRFAESDAIFARQQADRREEVARLEGEIESLQMQITHAATIVREARTVFLSWRKFNVEQKRALLSETVREIQVTKGEVFWVDYKYFPIVFQEALKDEITLPGANGFQPSDGAILDDLKRKLNMVWAGLIGPLTLLTLRLLGPGLRWA